MHSIVLVYFWSYSLQSIKFVYNINVNVEYFCSSNKYRTENRRKTFNASFGCFLTHRKLKKKKRKKKKSSNFEKDMQYMSEYFYKRFT